MSFANENLSSENWRYFLTDDSLISRQTVSRRMLTLINIHNLSRNFSSQVLCVFFQIFWSVSLILNLFLCRTPDIDTEKMRQAAALLLGTRDFRCFMGRPTRQPSNKTTIRSIYSLTITPSRPFMPESDPNTDLYTFWDIRCQGRAFLYRQVRTTYLVSVEILVTVDWYERKKITAMWL